MSRRWSLIVATLAVVAIACDAPAGGPVTGGPPPKPTKGYPSSMVALGDSITAGYGSCFTPTDVHATPGRPGDGTRSTRTTEDRPGESGDVGHARNLAGAGHAQTIRPLRPRPPRAARQITSPF